MLSFFIKHKFFQITVAFVFFSITGIATGLFSRQPVAEQKPMLDLALILAVDCSHSVSELEFDLQMGGLAKAISSPEIISAIANNTVAVMLVQWSGSNSQVISVPWTIIKDENSANRLSRRISRTSRQSLGKTSISAAMNFAVTQLKNSPFSANRQVIDISADGVNNDGITTRLARQRASDAGITINGLTILNDVRNLNLYFKQFITTGPGNFVIDANNYDDYSRAIKQKLLREIKGQQLS